MDDWRKVNGATFTDGQAAMLRLKNGKIVLAFYRDCEWLREGDDGDTPVEDCFERSFPGSLEDVEIDDIEAWRHPTPEELARESKEGQSDG